MHTELTITGKVAQFGRGAISDVSGKLMTQFAKNLEQLLETPSEEPNDPSEQNTESPKTETELNLLSVVAIPVLKRYGIPLAVLAVGVFMVIRYAIL